MSNQLTEDVNSHSNRHSQLKNNQQRPSSCCSSKAAPCNSHKCRLVLANNNLVPLRPSVTRLVLSWQAEQGTDHRGCHRQSRVTTSPLLQHQAEGHCPGSGVSAAAAGSGSLDSFPPPAVELAHLKPIIFTPTLILSLLQSQLNRSSLNPHRWFFTPMFMLEAPNCITWIPTGFLLPGVSGCSIIKVQQWESKGVQSLPCLPHPTGREEPTTAPAAG